MTAWSRTKIINAKYAGQMNREVLEVGKLTIAIQPEKCEVYYVITAT
jgi:hypothetical protein